MYGDQKSIDEGDFMLLTALSSRNTQRESLRHPHHLILPMTPTASAVTLFNQLTLEGYTTEQIWGVVSLRMARLIERHYAYISLSDPVEGVSHLFSLIDPLLENILPRVNLTDMIMQTIGHTEVMLDVRAYCWRLNLTLDYFPW